MRATGALPLVLMLLIPMVAPELSSALPDASVSARMTLLGLSVDLQGVYLDPQGWMILAGKGGLIAYAERGEVWTYRLLSVGGSDLTSVIWSGSSGLVVGKGRAVLVEGSGGSFTVRDVPFLRGDYVSAVWSLDGSFALLLTSDGRAYVYRPGEGAAYEVRAPPVRLLVASTVRLDLPYVPVVAEERKDRNTVVRKVLFVGRDLSVRGEDEDLSAWLKTLSLLLNRTLSRRPDVSGTVLITPVDGATDVLTSYQRNVIEVDDMIAVRRIALAFNVLGIYGVRSTVVAVGEGGGIATIDLRTLEVRYVSVPSSEKVSFIDPDTAVITSPGGLFVYSLSDGSVEHIPMPAKPTAFLPDGMFVADEGGRLYRFVRPEPWRGGLRLEAVIEDGYVSDMARIKEGVLLVVRKKGSSPEETRLMLFNGGGLRTLINSTRTVRAERLTYASSYGSTVLATGQGSAYLISGDGALRVWQGSNLGAPAWHPSGCMALVPGGSSTLLVLYGDSIVRYPVEGERDLTTASWSRDGRYALIGGSGVLYAFDGASIREVESNYVITYKSIASRPSRDEFLASTSLGLLKVVVEMGFPRPLEVISQRVVPTPDGRVLVDLFAVSHEPLKVESLTASSGSLYMRTWSGPSAMIPSCPYAFRVELTVPKGGTSVTSSVVQLQLETDRGPLDMGSYSVRLASPAGTSDGSSLLMLFLTAAGAGVIGVASFMAIRRLRRSRKSSGERLTVDRVDRTDEKGRAPEAGGEKGAEGAGEDYYGGDEKW